MKVKQFYAKNQFVIEGEGKTIFQSYNSTIAIYNHNGDDEESIMFGEDWDYSTTTSKYLNKFLEEEIYSSFLGLDGYSLSSELKMASNKKKYLQKCIEKGIIKYNEKL